MPYLIILLMFGTFIGGGYFYFTDSQEKMAKLQDDNARLEIAARDSETALLVAQRNILIAEEQINNLQVELREAEGYQDELIGKLRRHDLTALTMQKPGLVETRINDATKQIFKDIESDTANQ